MKTVEIKNEEQKKIVICSLRESNTGKTGSIILDPDVKLLYCVLCNSYMCFHITYAMSFEQVRKDRDAALKGICAGCGLYNLPDANYCNRCGRDLRVDPSIAEREGEARRLAMKHGDL